LSTLLQILPPLVGCFLPAAWVYAFWRIRKKRASFLRAWRCSDDGRFYSCVLDYLPAAIFFISYCRSLIASSVREPISQKFRK